MSPGRSVGTKACSTHARKLRELIGPFTLQHINDQVFLLPGVDRSYMQSIWTPAVRCIAVTSYGKDGGPVMPLDFSGSTADIAQLLHNIQRSGQIGILRGNA
jgi:hypothetical protein